MNLDNREMSFNDLPIEEKFNIVLRGNKKLSTDIKQLENTIAEYENRNEKLFEENRRLNNILDNIDETVIESQVATMKQRLVSSKEKIELLKIQLNRLGINDLFKDTYKSHVVAFLEENNLNYQDFIVFIIQREKKCG